MLKETKYLSPKILKYHYLIVNTFLMIINQYKNAVNNFMIID